MQISFLRPAILERAARLPTGLHLDKSWVQLGVYASTLGG